MHVFGEMFDDDIAAIKARGSASRVIPSILTVWFPGLQSHGDLIVFIVAKHPEC